MSWVAVAVAGGAVLGAVVQGNAAQSAASTQAGAAEQAAQLGYQEFGTITQQEQPFMAGGYGALGALEYGLGIPGYSPYAGALGSPTGGLGNFGGFAGGDRGGGRGGGRAFVGGGPVNPSFPNTGQPTGANGLGYGSLLQPFTAQNWQQLSPAYGFQRQQGMQGTLNQDATSQGALSGAAQKDLMSFNQNLANTSFNNAFNMYQTQQGNIYQRLAGLTQLGQAAAANTGQQGTALTGQIGQSITNVGTALAGGQVGAANAYAGALGGMSYLPWLYANQPRTPVGNSDITGAGDY